LALLTGGVNSIRAAMHGMIK